LSLGNDHVLAKWLLSAASQQDSTLCTQLVGSVRVPCRRLVGLITFVKSLQA